MTNLKTLQRELKVKNFIGWNSPQLIVHVIKKFFVVLRTSDFIEQEFHCFNGAEIA
jgi:hypothetical protein